MYHASSYTLRVVWVAVAVVGGEPFPVLWFSWCADFPGQHAEALLRPFRLVDREPCSAHLFDDVADRARSVFDDLCEHVGGVSSVVIVPTFSN